MDKRDTSYSTREQAARAEADIAQQRYRDLAEGIDHGIVWEADENLRFCMVSRRAEQMLGYSIEQWCHEPGFWINHVYPDDRDRVLAVFKKALTGEDQACDHRFITADGRVVWFHTGVHAARVEDQIVYRGLSVEITYLKEVEEKLKQKTEEAEEANRTKSHFLSIASHEIRNGLNAIIGYAHLLADGTMPQEKRAEMYKHILRCAHDLNDLVNRILDVEKIETGRMQLQANISEVFLPDILRQILEDLRFIWSEKGLTVELHDDLTVPCIRSDPGKLRQIFTNLIVNAIKFTEKGAISVQILHHSQAKEISVQIQDTGIGIPEEDLPHLFKPFYQSGGAVAPVGTGLGLSIVKKLVDLLKGRIEVKSQQGIGSTFTVTLPYDAC